MSVNHPGQPEYRPYQQRQPYQPRQPYRPQPMEPTPAPGPGQSGCPSGIPYTVQPGDSLPDIASRLGFSLNELASLNQNINWQGPLPVGQTICLPSE